MIYAHIDEAKNYTALGDALMWALSQLSRPDLAALPAGKTEFIPGKAWYSVDEPCTQPADEVPFEAHREFIDVQMTIEGDELIGYAPRRALTPKGEYSADEDIQYFDGDGMLLDCTGGMFAVFFPEDAHRPCVAPGGPQKIRKIVVKLHRSLLKRKAMIV